VAPAGAVTVAPGSDLNAAVQAQPAGTTFYLSGGVHTLGTDPYGQVIPKDDDRFIGAPGAVLDGQHANLYAFTGSATGVRIEHLTIRNFGSAGTTNNEGVVNHDAGTGWTITANTVTGNAGAGVFIGSGNTVSSNCLSGNGQYGFSSYSPTGITTVTVTGNEITGNNSDDWETREPGCGCTGGGKFWDTHGATVTGNYVHDNRGVGLWADTNNTGFLFSGNYIADNDAEGIFYEISYNAAITDNTFVRNGLVKGPTNPSFPTGAIYLSESGSDSRVPGPYNTAFTVSGNTFTDNWGGVILWENADRFAGSPANTSSGTGTLVRPGVDMATACNETTIATAPYYDDCRWKTQNVTVTRNTFNANPAAIGHGCSAETSCSQNGIFSNWGTYPTWSPYQGPVVSDHITYSQNNHFTANTYTGPWTFRAHDLDATLTPTTWQTTPTNQDTDSTGLTP
jgi:hypothetical protein